MRLEESAIFSWRIGSPLKIGMRAMAPFSLSTASGRFWSVMKPSTMEPCGQGAQATTSGLSRAPTGRLSLATSTLMVGSRSTTFCISIDGLPPRAI